MNDLKKLQAEYGDLQILINYLKAEYKKKCDEQIAVRKQIEKLELDYYKNLPPPMHAE